jgi:hypothetical protein
MNYTELKKAIRGYVENDFPTITFADSVTTFTSDEQLAVFVKQAEQRIFNSVQFPSLRKNVTGTCTVNNKYLQCPSDFLAPYSMAVIDADGRYFYLLNKDVNFIREAYPIPTGSGNTGRPRHYAIFGPDYSLPLELTFILGPTPNYAYGVELHYYYYPESISEAVSGQSWLGDNFDTVLLYGSLQEAYTFIKAEQDMLVRIDAQYKEALSLAKRLGDGMERQDAYRSGQVRYPVK